MLAARIMMQHDPFRASTSILEELNRRLCDRPVRQLSTDQWERIGHMAIIAYGQCADGEPVRGDVLQR